MRATNCLDHPAGHARLTSSGVRHFLNAGVSRQHTQLTHGGGDGGGGGGDGGGGGGEDDDDDDDSDGWFKLCLLHAIQSCKQFSASSLSSLVALSSGIATHSVQLLS